MALLTLAYLKKKGAGGKEDSKKKRKTSGKAPENEYHVNTRIMYSNPHLNLLSLSMAGIVVTASQREKLIYRFSNQPKVTQEV